MGQKRHKPEDTVMKLRQVDVLRGQGTSMADAIRQIGVTPLTYYLGPKTYGGMRPDQVKKLQKRMNSLEKLLLSRRSTNSFLGRLPRETSEPRAQKTVH